MVPADLEMTRRALGSIDSEQAKTALLLSPAVDQLQLFESAFGNSEIYCYNRRIWDLDETHQGRFDLIFLGNVLMYSPNPALWLRNLFGSARLVLVQDIIERYRSHDAPGFGSDGDRVRYEFVARGVVSPQRPAFDLSQIEQPCLYFETYRPDPNSLHFIGLWKGQALEAGTNLSFETRFASAAHVLWLKTRARSKAFLVQSGFSSSPR